MLKNYLKVAYRNLFKNPSYTFINVAGLAAGIAACLLIAFFIRDELAFDRFHANGDRIARVTSAYTDEAGSRAFARTYPAIAPSLRTDFSEVLETVRFQRYQGALRQGDLIFNEDRMFFAGASIFGIFTFPLLRGNPETALTQPNSAVLTESTARRYFGNEDPMGKTVALSDTLEFAVTGVAADVPAQSHLQFDILLSYETWKQIQLARDRDLDNLWTAGTNYTYALFSSLEAISSIESQLPAYLERQIGSQENAGAVMSLHLQPIRDIHLHSDLRQELGSNGNLTFLYVFSVIAAFILLISCINFMNLSTARSTQRAREVGVRKALGARRGQLVKQFLGEALLLCSAAFALAAILVAVLLPAFNVFTGKAIAFDASGFGVGLLAAGGLLVVVSALGGVYPAFVLSAFRAAHVIKGAPGGKRQLSGRIRQALVVFQFALSIAIIAGTIVARQQLQYMQSRDLGFEGEQVLVLPFNWERAVIDQYETLKQELLTLASVQNVTASGDVPGRMFTSMSYWIEGMPEGESGGINALIVDPDFTETYGLQMLAGRDFSPDLAANLGESFLLNERAVQEMGMTPDEVIGKRFRMNETGPVVGVVKDFHFEGLQNEIEPLVMTVWPDWFGYVSLRVESGRMQKTIEQIEAQWTALFPSLPFEYFFLDEDFGRQYQAEQRFEQVFFVFALLAILISCLGLYGLATFMAEKRTKEIGLRKVLGATEAGVVWMFSSEFARLVVVAFVIAAPVAYLAMSRWLERFSYRIDVEWWMPVLAGGLAMTIALLSIGYQFLKAARANPVDALKYE